MRWYSTRHAALLLASSLALTAGAALGQSAPPAAMQAGTATDYMEPMTLTDAKVGAFFAAVEEYRALGDKTAAADPSRPEAFARALGASKDSEGILKKHGFADVGEFQRVAYNAAMAYGVLQKGGKEAVKERLDEAKTDQARAMEKMAQQLSPEQMKMVASQMEAGLAMAGKMQDVPEENLELMKKYRERMAKLGAG